MKMVPKIHRALVLAALTLLAGGARASIVYQDVDLVSNTTALSTPVTVTSPGSYRATLVDFEYPEPFEILALAVTQGGDALGMTLGTDSFVFDVAAPGTLMTHVKAVPGSGGTGLYGYTLELLGVPIPAAAWLFLSGLAGISVVARRGPCSRLA
jgi:hypothetical protein